MNSPNNAESIIWAYGISFLFLFFIFYFCLLIHYYWPAVHQSGPPVPSHSTPINSNTIHCHLFHLNSPNGAFWHHLGFCSCHSPLSTPPCLLIQLPSTPPPSTISSISTAQMVPFGIVWAFFLSLTTVHPPMLSVNPHRFHSPICPPRAFSLNSHQLHHHPPPPLPSQQPKQCLLALFGLSFTNPAPPCSHSTPINSLFHLNSPNGAFRHHLGFCSCHSPLSTPPMPSHSTPINTLSSTATSFISTAQMVPFGIVWAFIR